MVSTYRLEGQLHKRSVIDVPDLISRPVMAGPAELTASRKTSLASGGGGGAEGETGEKVSLTGVLKERMHVDGTDRMTDRLERRLSDMMVVVTTVCVV